MKRWNNIAWISFIIAIGLFGVCPDLFAAEGTGEWRETYDLVMRWVNFGILAFIIVKFARTPLKEFIFGQRKNLIRELEQREAEKKAITEKVDAVIAELKENQARVEDLKTRIIEQGKKKRQEIIESATEQSRQMLSDTQMRLAHQVSREKYRLRSEFVETAIGLALDRLPKIVTESDNQKFIEIFVSGTSKR